MNVPELLAVVVAATEFFKKAITKVFRVEMKGKAAVILAVLVSVGVVFVKAILGDVPLTLALVPTLVQVIIGSTMGYSIFTK